MQDSSKIVKRPVYSLLKVKIQEEWNTKKWEKPTEGLTTTWYKSVQWSCAG